MAEKAVYSLTETGNEEFEKLMLDIASKPIYIFLDFNAVIVNLDSLSPERQRQCLDSIEKNVKIIKSYLEDNIERKKTCPKSLKQERRLCSSSIFYFRQLKHGLHR